MNMTSNTAKQTVFILGFAAIMIAWSFHLSSMGE